MKILYVATLVRGFEDLLRGELEAKGLPTFILPLKYLLEHGHSVDLILISNYTKPINIKVDWIQNENIIANINNDLTITNKWKKKINIAKTILEEWKTIQLALKRNHYDFVYCHGTAAILGNLAANMMGVRCGYRLYGTVHLYNDILKIGKFKAAVKNLTYYLIFKMKKDFLLITDDGSHGDVVYQYWKPRGTTYPLYFWRNGVDIESITELENEGDVPQEPFLFTAGRIDKLKRQDIIIKMLHLLHKKQIKIHLYLAGHVECKKYIEEIENLVKMYGLESYVHFMGAIPRRYMKKMAYYSKAMILWSDIANNGNVFYEVFSTGALIVAINDGSLDPFVTRDKNIFLADNIEEAVEDIQKLLNLSQLERSKMQRAAICQSVKTIPSWEKRVYREIKLLEKYGNNS